VRLIEQAGRRGDLRRRLAGSQQALGGVQSQRHQHLLRRGVALRVEAAQKMERAQSGNRGQILERDALAEMRVHVVEHRREALRLF
jgi:hypothetical protein